MNYIVPMVCPGYYQIFGHLLAWGFGCAAFPLPFAGPGAATMEPARGEPRE